MPAIRTTWSTFAADVQKRLNADTALIRNAALEVAQQSLRDAVRETNKADAVDQGFFKLSWGARPTARGAVVENTAPYAGVLEYGRRPNRPGPPLQPIIEWVHRKLLGDIRGQYRAAKAIALGIARGGSKSRKDRAAAVRDVRQAFGNQGNALSAAVIFRAMAIRDKIHYRGSPPRRILQKTLPAIRKRMKVAFRRELRRKR